MYLAVNNLLPFLIVPVILKVNDVQSHESPKFIRNCEDPLIRAHLIKYNHTYCAHACGLIPDKSRARILSASLNTDDINNKRPSARCDDTSGNCICTSACIDTTRHRQGFNPSSSSSICPPRLTDPLDTDTSPSSTTTSSCSFQCSLMCPGGSGQICGEVNPLGPDRNIFARICTCICPPPSLQSCLAQTLVNSISPLKTLKLNVSFITGILISRRLIPLVLLLSAVGLSVTFTALLQSLSLAIILCDSVIQLFDK